MGKALLVPMNVTAKVVRQQTVVPTLEADPFNRTATLEPGVHLHWALPDALTSGRILTDKTQEAVFPGVPDVWLVVRVNPVPHPVPKDYRRTWAGWVLDSAARLATPIAQWKGKATKSEDPVHTVAGLLPSAASLGYPGWGHWTANNQFDIASAAYYPSARGRLGFFDDLHGLTAKGTVTYFVLGWYSTHGHDPLYNSDDRATLMEAWKLRTSSGTYVVDELSTTTSVSGIAGASIWNPSKFEVARTVTLPNDVAPWISERIRALPVSAHIQRLQKTANSIPNPAVGIGRARHSWQQVEYISPFAGPGELRCHGTVLEVPLAGGVKPSDLKPEQLHLYASATRAAAAVAVQDKENSYPEHAEQILDNLENKKQTPAGVVDMPGAAHAQTFQSVPGKPARFARLEVHPLRESVVSDRPSNFTLNVEDASGPVMAGNWPRVASRRNPSFGMARKSLELASPRHLTDLIGPAGPTEKQADAWIHNTFMPAFNTLLGTRNTVDARLIRVLDYRSNTPEPSVGHKIGAIAGDSAGSWLDVQDTDALRRLHRSAWGATIRLPSADNVYELPGPNWYRPWSPQIVVSNAGRSYRFGEDGRFTPDGFLECRTSGEVLASLKVGQSPTAVGGQILADPGLISNTALIPAEATALLHEAVLFDSDSAEVLANLVAGASGAASALQYRSAIRSLWLARDWTHAADVTQAISDAVRTTGTVPSPVAVTPWTDPLDPVYLDVRYTHAFSSLEKDWSLQQDFVQMTPTSASATQPPPAQHKTFNERTRVTASVLKVLQSAFVDKLTLDVHGNYVAAQSPPPGIDADSLNRVDLISAALTKFDENVLSSGLRERTGQLCIDRLEVVDTYGIARVWSRPEQAPHDPQPVWCAILPPRLPYWSRVQHRLLSAANPAEEATRFAHAVCGFLLPDFIEHSLEIFDGDGNPIGQLSSDAPRLGNGAWKPKPNSSTTLRVTFQPHPWLMHKGLPLDAIANPILRSVVAGIEAQNVTVPPESSQQDWYETGLTALLRIVDTVRGTLDPTVSNPNRVLRLLGDPIVVLNSRFRLEATSATSVSELKLGPHSLPSDEGRPLAVPLRIGDISRPDDAVIGCFLPGASAVQSRFAPVSRDAAQQAIVHPLSSGGSGGTRPVTHVFVENSDCTFDIAVGQTREFIVLAETGGGLYSTTGVLPRKKITIPVEQIEAALHNIAASVRVGPLMGLPSGGIELKPAIAPIELEGYDSTFVHLDAARTWVERAVPAVAPVAELPNGRSTLTNGWLRVSRYRSIQA